jgi:hypothetical protein
MRPITLILAIVLPAAFELSCVSQDAVGAFAGSSVSGLQKGNLVLRDIAASCTRTVLAEQPFDQFVLTPESARSLQICADQIPTGQLLAVSKVLVAYFSALGELAASGTSSKATAQDAGKGADAMKEKTSGTGPASAQQALSSASSLAKILDNLATQRLREKAIRNALTEADGAVANLTRTLGEAIAQDYVGQLLLDERNKEAIRLTRLANNPTPKPLFGDLLTLNSQWRQVSATLDARAAAAHFYIETLEQIRNGHAALVRQAQSTGLKSKELGPALAPYSASLAELEIQIQKFF